MKLRSWLRGFHEDLPFELDTGHLTQKLTFFFGANPLCYINIIVY
jgi:hypothetical protein